VAARLGWILSGGGRALKGLTDRQINPLTRVSATKIGRGQKLKRLFSCGGGAVWLALERPPRAQGFDRKKATSRPA
jgi:hypothetical protein